MINDDKEIVFTPASDYPEYTYINVRLTTGIQDINGNSLPANEEYSFRTGPSDVTPPTLVSKSPDSGETCVPLDHNIVVTFSEGMDENSAHNGTVLVTGNYRGSYACNYSWSNNSTVLTIDPVVNFHSEEDITVSVTTGLKDKGGNPLDHNYIWTFTGADLFPPAPPHNIQSVTGNLLVQLTWDPSPTPDAERYRIYRKRSNDPAYQVIFTTSPGAPLVYTDIVPENFTHYYYKISALDEAGNESLLSPYHEAYAWKAGTIDISGVINHNTTLSGGGTLYNLTGDLRIRNNATLTIESGSIIEFNSSKIEVGYGFNPTSPGHLIADNVTFRSTYNSSDRSLFIHISGSDAIITNCSFDNVYIQSNDGCNFNSTNNSFDNVNYPFTIYDPSVNPILNNNLFGSSVSSPGIAIAGFIDSDFILKNQSLTYYLAGNLYIRNNSTCTIESGSIIEFNSSKIEVGYGFNPTSPGHLIADSVTFRSTYNSSDRSLFIHISGSDAIITNCSFDNVYIQSNTGGNFIATNNFFENLSLPLILNSPNFTPTINNNTFSPTVENHCIGLYGQISSNLTLLNYNLQYYLTGDLRIRGDATLTIESGSVIEFNSSGIEVGYGSFPTSPGHLVADSITFRSTYNATDRRLLVHITGSDATITNCSFDNVYLRCNTGASLNTYYNSFLNTANSFYLEDNIIAFINNNDFINTSNFGVYYSGTSLINATNNFWGHPTGPYHSSNPGGQGCEVSDNIDFTPWSSSAFCPFFETNLSSINETRDVDEIIQINLVLYNHGNQNLTFQIQENDTSSVNIPWLNLSTNSGNISPLDSLFVVVELNTSGLQFNTTYTTNLFIQNNSINKPEHIIPVSLNILHVNQPPVFSSSLSVTFKEDEFFTQNFSNWYQYISDFETPDSLLVWGFIPGIHVTYQLYSDSVNLNAPINWNGYDTLYATISDGSLSDTTALHVYVRSVNDPPQIEPPIPLINFLEDSSYIFDLDDHIYDVDHSAIEITWGFGFPSNNLSEINYNKGKFESGYENNVKTRKLDLNFRSNERVDVLNQDNSDNNNSSPFEFNKLNFEYKSIGNLKELNYSNDLFTNYKVYKGNNDSLIINIDSLTHITTISATSNFYASNIPIFFIALDDSNASDQDTTSIIIQPVNDQPVISSIPSATIVEDDSLVINYDYLDGFVSDPDTPDSLLTYRIYSTILLIDSTYQKIEIYGPPDWFGNDSLQVIVFDQFFLSDTTVWFIEVSPMNDPPVAIADSATALEDAPEVIPVLANDSDIDNDLLVVATVTQGMNGSVAINPDSTLTYTPNPNYNGVDQFSYVVSDGNGGLDTADVFITIIEANDPPVLLPLPDITFNEDTIYFKPIIDWYPMVTDPDNQDSVLTWNLFGMDHVFVSQVADTLNFTSILNWFGIDSLSVEVSDGNLSDTTELLVQVKPVNDSPILALPDSLFCFEDSSISIDLDTMVADIDDPIDSLEWAFHFIEVNRSVSDSIKLLYDSLNHTLTFLPDSNYFVSNQQFEISVQDTSGGLDRDTLQFTVIPINDSPQILQPLQQLSFNEDDSLMYPIANWYPFVKDPDNVDSTLIYSVISGYFVTAQSILASFKFKAGLNWFGIDTLVLVISDGQHSDSAKFQVKVNAVNDSPAIADSLPAFLEFVSTDSVQLNIWNYVEDIETPDSLLQYNFSTDTSGIFVNYNQSQGLLKVSAQLSFTGEGELFIEVVDDSGAAALDTIAIMVNPNSIDLWNGEIPQIYILYQNYPNPFNPVTHIRYGVPRTSHVKIELYNILGQRVAVMLDRRMQPGYHLIKFDASHLASGIYIYRMQSRDFNKVRKMLLIK